MMDSLPAIPRLQPKPDGNAYRWLRRILPVLFVLGLLTWGIVWTIQQQQADAVSRARDDLHQLSIERNVTARTALVKHASQQMEKSGASGRTPGAILLKYVIDVLSVTDGQLPTAPAELQLEAVETDDLLLAAETLLGIRRLGLAEPIAQVAYARSDQRLRILKLMVSVEYELGNDELVLACCREWQQLDPGASIPFLITAFVFENRGKLQLVLEPLKQAIERLPAPATTYRTQLVEYLLELRQIVAARREFEALRSVTEFPAISLTEARLLYAEGDHVHALEMAKSLNAATPDQPAIMALVGKILLATNDPATALPILTTLVESFPYEAEAHYLVGQALARLKRTDDARRHLDRHQALVRAKTAIHKLQRQAGREPDNLEIRLELVRECDEVHWVEKSAFWRDSVEALRSARKARLSKP